MKLAYKLILLTCLLSCTATSWGQTKVFKPRPLTIDLVNIKSDVSKWTKEERKVLEKIQKEQDQIKKAKDKYYDFKLDSLHLANKKAAKRRLAKEKLKGLKTKKIRLAKNKGKEEISRQMADLGIPPADLAKLAIWKDSVQSSRAKADSLTFTELYSSAKDSLFNLATDTAALSQYSHKAEDLISLDSSQYQHYKSLQQSYDSLDLLSSTDDMILDSLSNTLAAYHISKDSLLLMANTEFEGELESKLMSALDQAPASGFESMDKQQEMMFQDYDQMIQSNEYLELMETMPGRKAEIEKAIATKSIDPSQLPIPMDAFKGKEELLKKAMKAQSLVHEKPKFKEILSNLVNQDMEELKTQKVVERFSIAGQIQISEFDPVIVDFSPSIAYGFTGKINLGAGMSGRKQFGKSKPQKEEKDLLSFRGFMDYGSFNGFYLHIEYEYSGLMTTNPDSQLERRVWSDRYLIGLGKELKLKGIFTGTVLFLYSLDKNLESSPNPQRFQVRYGVKI